MAATGLAMESSDTCPETIINQASSSENSGGIIANDSERNRSRKSSRNPGEKRTRKRSISPVPSSRQKMHKSATEQPPLISTSPPSATNYFGAEHAQSGAHCMSFPSHGGPANSRELSWLPPSETTLQSQMRQNQLMLTQLSQSVTLLNNRLSSLEPRCETVSHCPSSDEDSADEQSFLAAGDTLLHDVDDRSPQNSGENPIIAQDVDDLFHHEEQFYEATEPTGPTVSDRVAKVLNSGWRTKVTEDMTKSVTEKYHRPLNCSNLTVPKVNTELWPKLKGSSRSCDIKMQQTQSLVMKAAIPLAQLLDKISSSSAGISNDKRDCAVLALDSLRLLCFANAHINQRRRELLKPDVQEQYRQLFSHSNPVTDYLLGDDLEKQVKTINEVSKVGSRVSGKYPYGQQQYGQQRPRHMFKIQGRSSNNRLPFLGRGHSRHQNPYRKRDPKGKPVATPRLNQ